MPLIAAKLTKIYFNPKSAKPLTIHQVLHSFGLLVLFVIIMLLSYLILQDLRLN